MLTQLTLFNDLVAGLSFTKPNWLEESDVNASVILTHEPENQFDARAIRVDVRGMKVGYIPKDQTIQIHQLWDNAIPFVAVVRNISFGGNYPKVWLRVTITL